MQKLKGEKESECKVERLDSVCSDQWYIGE